MSAESGHSVREPRDARHRELILLLRVQFVASTTGVLAAYLLFPNPRASHVFLVSGSTLLVLAALGFAPMAYRTRARAYALMFMAMAVALAYFAGPHAATFVIVCNAIILPLILLPPREATGFAACCFGLVSFVAWLHVQGLTGVEFPRRDFGPTESGAWVSTMIAILTIFVPFAVLAGRLLRMYQTAHELSDRLVEDLKAEVTEREAAIEALQRAERRLTHAQKLELLGQLAGGLAHDMNNALTVIQGEASFLGEADAESREIIIEHSQHAAALTRQLLTLGRRDVVQPRPVDFVDEVRRSLASVKKLLPSEIRVFETYSSESSTVHADPSQLAQIVLNLVVNARDAMVGGGELRVSVEGDSDSTGHVVLTISDTGHGIEPDDLERVFEPFYSTKDEGLGTGLGLANVRDLVDGLGGTLRVESRVGRGTTMRIRLPVTVAEAPEQEDVPADGALQTRSGNILLVEDRDSVRRITKSILANAGHEVFEARNGSAAIELLTEGGPIDLVITDVVMPDGGASVVIEWLSRNRPGLPLLVMSGYTEDEQLLRGLRTGELPFLRKPFSSEELLATTRTLLSSDSLAH